MRREAKIPDATIERIALYSRPLEDLLEKGIMVVSSEGLAALCRVNPAQVRKDLSFFGEFGVRGVGYDVRDLLMSIKRILGSDREWKLGIVGLGYMGMALVQHENFLKRRYRFVAAFDSDPKTIGRRLSSELIVEPLREMKTSVKKLGVEIGIITIEPPGAQSVADILAEAGVRSILNFSPIQVRQPEYCLVDNVDFTVNLDNLAYHLNKID